MAHLSTIDLVGFWLGIFLTFAILSFLYKDNPIYKLAEHLFIGVSIGFVVMKQYYDTVRPKLIENLADGQLWYLVGLGLSIMLFMKLSRRWGWMGRFPIAFVVAFYAGLQINGYAQGDLGKQLEAAMQPVVDYQVNINATPETEAERAEQLGRLQTLPGVSPAVAERILEEAPFSSLDELGQIEGLTDAQRLSLSDARGSIEGLDAQATLGDGSEVYWFGTFSQLLLFLGLIAGLVYFYFSLPQTGAVGKVSRFGIWVLMIGFGASFGYTVQGRIALAIGRARHVMGSDKDENLAAQIQGSTVALISIAFIIVALVIWEVRRRRQTQ